VWPGVGPNAAPCLRGSICNICRDDKANLYTSHGRRTAAWLCKQCTSTPPSGATPTELGERLYGFYIWPPRDETTVTPGVLPRGAPVTVPALTQHPAEQYIERREKAALAQQTAAAKEQAESASILLSAFTNAQLSDGQAEHMLRLFRDLKGKNIVKFEERNIPLQMTTLRKNEGDLNHVETTTTLIDSAALLQGEKNVALVKTDALYSLQVSLLDKNVPIDSIYWGRGEQFSNSCPSLKDWDAGDVPFQPRWAEFSKDVPMDGFPLFLFVSSDAVLSWGTKKYPIYFSIANVPEKMRSFVVRLAGSVTCRSGYDLFFFGGRI
jgi:hypothetical protein